VDYETIASNNFFFTILRSNYVVKFLDLKKSFYCIFFLSYIRFSFFLPLRLHPEPFRITAHNTSPNSIGTQNPEHHSIS
jgi:hypothetical protein